RRWHSCHNFSQKTKRGARSVPGQRGKREEGEPKPVAAPAQEQEAGVSAAAEASSDALQKMTAEKEDLTDTLGRLQAAFYNSRKRVEKERAQERQRGVELLVENLLPVLDGFDRALETHDDPAYEIYRKGFELIRRQLWDALAKQGLQRMDAVGKD